MYVVQERSAMVIMSMSFVSVNNIATSPSLKNTTQFIVAGLLLGKAKLFCENYCAYFFDVFRKIFPLAPRVGFCSPETGKLLLEKN
jgi:hypothetical protein